MLVASPGDGHEGVHVALHEAHWLDVCIRLLQRQLHVRAALIRTHSRRHQVRKRPASNQVSINKR